MLRAMFGMGGSEILVILIVALLFLGPDKLPDAAKQISKGIRDIKKQSRVLQQTIEDDEHIGGAIRDLKSALRGEEIAPRPRKPKPPKQIEAAPTPDPGPAIGAVSAAVVAATAESADPAAAATMPVAGAHADRDAVYDADAEVAANALASPPPAHTPAHAAAPAAAGDVPASGESVASQASDHGETAAAKLTLPPTAGEDAAAATARDDAHSAELAQLVKPAPNTIARGQAPAAPSEPPEPKHG